MGAFEDQQRKNVQTQLAAGAITQAQADAALAGISQAASSGGTYTGSNNSSSNVSLAPSSTAVNNAASSSTPLTPQVTTEKTWQDFLPSGFDLSTPEAPEYNYTPQTYTIPTPTVPLAPGMTLVGTKASRDQFNIEEANRQARAQGLYGAALNQYENKIKNKNSIISAAQSALKDYLDDQYRYDALDETKRVNDQQNSVSLMPYSQLTKQQEINNAWDRFSAGVATADDYTLLGITQGTMPWSITKDQQTLDVSRSKAASKDYVGGGGGNVIPEDPFKNSGGNSVINGYTLKHINNYIDRQRKRLKSADAVYSYVANVKWLNPQFKAAVLQVLDEVQGEQ